MALNQLSLLQTHREHRGGSNVAPAAETGVTQPQAQESLQLPEAERGKECHLEPLPCWHLDVNWLSETHINKFLLFYMLLE